MGEWMSQKGEKIKHIYGKFNNIGSADENKERKTLLQKFLPLSEVEIQGLLHSAQANLAWFQSLQLPSTQSESPVRTTHNESRASQSQARNKPMLNNGWVLAYDWLALDSLWVVSTVLLL
jgi:hypothetical protein